MRECGRVTDPAQSNKQVRSSGEVRPSTERITASDRTSNAVSQPTRVAG